MISTMCAGKGDKYVATMEDDVGTSAESKGTVCEVCIQHLAITFSLSILSLCLRMFDTPQVLYMNGWVLWHSATSFSNSRRSSNLRWYNNLSELVKDSPSFQDVFADGTVLSKWVYRSLSDMYGWYIDSGDAPKNQFWKLLTELGAVYKGVA